MSPLIAPPLRGSWEADRLEESIPGDDYYRHREEYLRRMRIMYTITLMVCLNLRGKLAQIEAAKIFCEQYKLYVKGPALVTTCAFLYGRQYGMWEAGAIERIDLPELKNIKKEVKGRPDLKEHLEQAKVTSEVGVRRVAETLKYAIGEANATETLSQWEGSGGSAATHWG